MKRLLDFLTTTAIGGLLVVVPALLLALIADDMLLMVEGLVAPVAELFPGDLIGGPSTATILALLVIFGLCFGFGLVARTAIGSRAGGWVERAALRRIPMYGLLKTLTQQIAGVGDKDDSSFAPAVLSIGPDAFQLVYIIEEAEDGFVAVMVPSVPAGLAGPLQYVREERVRRLDAPLGLVVQSLQTYGVGAGRYFAEGRNAHLQEPVPEPIGEETPAMPDADHIRHVYDRYPQLLSKGDVEGIVDLYAEDATIEDPIGSQPRRGREAIRAFYQASAGAVTMKRTGPVRVAGCEAATPVVVLMGPEGQQSALDVISMMRFDADGKITSMRAFWSMDAVRPATDADRA